MHLSSALSPAPVRMWLPGSGPLLPLIVASRDNKEREPASPVEGERDGRETDKVKGTPDQAEGEREKVDQDIDQKTQKQGNQGGKKRP